MINLGTAERFMDFTVRQCVVHLFVKVHMGERLMDFTMDSGPKYSSRSSSSSWAVGIVVRFMGFIMNSGLNEPK